MSEWSPHSSKKKVNLRKLESFVFGWIRRSRMSSTYYSSCIATLCNKNLQDRTELELQSLCVGPCPSCYKYMVMIDFHYSLLLWFLCPLFLFLLLLCLCFHCHIPMHIWVQMFFFFGVTGYWILSIAVYTTKWQVTFHMPTIIPMLFFYSNTNSRSL